MSRVATAGKAREVLTFAEGVYKLQVPVARKLLKENSYRHGALVWVFFFHWILSTESGV